MKEFPSLKTEKLVLVSYREGDEEQLKRILQQPEVMKAVLQNNLNGPTRFLTQLKEECSGDRLAIHWMVRLRADDRLIGCVKANETSPGSVELTFFLKDEERHRPEAEMREQKRYGSEMVKGVVDYLLSLRRVKKLWARTCSRGSSAILSKLNFTRPNGDFDSLIELHCVSEICAESGQF